MNFISLLLFIALVCKSSSSCCQGNENTLNVGDVAPPIQGVKWLKGDSVVSFQKGHVYIVEFGYIGCPMCNISIPHMTEIAEKYKGKATLVSIFYNEKHSRMKRFLESMGDRIKYTVGIDNEIGKNMEKSWLKASGISYAPSAFVLNQNGKIVWIGSPQKGAGIEEAIDAAIHGIGFEKLRLNGYLQNSFLQAARWAKEEGDFESAILILDSAIILNPRYSPLHMTKLDYLLESDENKGYLYARQLLEKEFKNDPNILHRYISNKMISLYQNGEIKNIDWDLIVALNEQALKVNPYELHSFSMCRDIALAYAQKKNYEKAIEIMGKAIADLEKGNYNKEESDGVKSFLAGSLDFILKMKSEQKLN